MIRIALLEIQEFTERFERTLTASCDTCPFLKARVCTYSVFQRVMQMFSSRRLCVHHPDLARVPRDPRGVGFAPKLQ